MECEHEFTTEVVAAEILKNGETALSVIRDAVKISSGGTNHCPTRQKRRQAAKEDVLGRLVKSAKQQKSKQKPLQHRQSAMESMQLFNLFIQRVSNPVQGGLLLHRHGQNKYRFVIGSRLSRVKLAFADYRGHVGSNRRFILPRSNLLISLSTPASTLLYFASSQTNIQHA